MARRRTRFTCSNREPEPRTRKPVLTRIAIRFRLKNPLTIRRIAAGAVVWLVCQTALPIAANQDALATVRELYLAADYERALSTIDRLDADTRNRIDIADYRVL